ncbi:MAG: MFS transporter, partial [Desulfobacterales bacterium]
IIGVPIGLLVLFRLKSPKADRKPDLGEYFQIVMNTVKTKELIVIYLITIFGLIMIWGSYISYFPILMGIKIHQKPLIIGLIMTSMTLCSALSSSQMGRLSKRFSSRLLLMLSFMLYCMALLMIPFIEQRWLFLIPISIFGIAQGIFIPNLQYFLGKLSSMENRGIVMALYGSSIRIGQALGPLAMGLIFPVVGINGVFYVCSGIAFVMIASISVLVDMKPNTGKEKLGRI